MAGMRVCRTSRSRSQIRFVILLTSGKPTSAPGALSSVVFMVLLALVFDFPKKLSVIDASYSCPTDGNFGEDLTGEKNEDRLFCIARISGGGCGCASRYGRWI